MVKLKGKEALHSEIIKDLLITEELKNIQLVIFENKDCKARLVAKNSYNSYVRYDLYNTWEKVSINLFSECKKLSSYQKNNVLLKGTQFYK